MSSFRDNEGRRWDVAVTVATVKRVRSLCDVDLMGIVDSDGELLERLFSDPVLLVDVLYAVCQPQAEDRGVTDVAFGESLAGDAVAAATDALLEGIVDFFPHAPTRENLRAVLQQLRQAMDRVAETSQAAIEEGLLQKRTDEAVQAARRQIYGVPPIEPPASSESTPAA